MNRPVSIAGVADLKMCCLVTDNNIRNRFLKKSTLIHKYTILRIMTYTLVEWTGIAKMRVYISWRRRLAANFDGGECDET